MTVRGLGDEKVTSYGGRYYGSWAGPSQGRGDEVGGEQNCRQEEGRYTERKLS